MTVNEAPFLGSLALYSPASYIQAYSIIVTFERNGEPLDSCEEYHIVITLTLTITAPKIEPLGRLAIACSSRWHKWVHIPVSIYLHMKMEKNHGGGDSHHHCCHARPLLEGSVRHTEIRETTA